MDPFGRPLVRGPGDEALENDTRQAQLARGRSWTPSYGGRRQAGTVVRGGLLHNPVTKFVLPVRTDGCTVFFGGREAADAACRCQGVVLGYLLALFLGVPSSGPSATPSEGEPEEGAREKGKKKEVLWAGPAPPPGTELKLMLVVRDDLGMSAGKIAAQCAHAAVGIVQKLQARCRRDNSLNDSDSFCTF